MVFALALLVPLFIGITIAPNASALTWDGGTTVAIADRTAARFDGDNSRTGNLMVVWQFNDGGGTGIDQVTKAFSSNGGSTWGSVTVVDTITTIGVPDIVNIGNNDFQVCIGGQPGQSADGSAINMYRTANGGDDWTVRTPIQSPAGHLDTCVFGEIPGPNVALSYFSDATTLAVNRLSTDNTNTFGAYTTIATQAVAERVENYASKTDDTESWAWAVGSLGMCITVDNGATFTCGKSASNPSFMVDNLAITHLGGSTWMMMGTPAAATPVYYVKTFDDGVSWTVPTLAFTPQDTIGDLRIFSVNSQQVHAVYTAVVAGGGNLDTRSTSNQGTTWTSATTLRGGATGHFCNGFGYPLRGIDLRTVDGLVQVLLMEGTSAGGGGCADPTGRTILFEAEYAASTAGAGGADAVVTLAQTLSGFAVNQFSNVVIVRTSTDQFVRTYTGQTLENLGSFDTDCQSSDRVAVRNTGNIVAFIDCDGLNDEHTLMLKSNTLGTPIFPTCSYCSDDDIVLGEAVLGDYNQIQEIAEFPLDYSGAGSGGVITDRYTGVGFSKLTGQIGVLVYTNSNNFPDTFDREERSFSGTTVPSQLCATTKNAGYYLAAAHPSTQTHVYRIDFSIGVTDSLLIDSFNGPQFFESAVGIACGPDDIIIESGLQDRIVSYDYIAGTHNWEQPTAGAAARGVAVSADGLWYAFVDGDNIKIGDAQTGNVTCSNTPLPDQGNFFQMHISQKGQSLFVAMTDADFGLVARYNIIPCTTVTPISDTAGLGVTEPQVPTGTSAAGLEGVGARVAEFFGLTGSGATVQGLAILGALINLGIMLLAFILLGGLKRDKQGRLQKLEYASRGGFYAGVVAFFIIGFVGLYPLLVMFGAVVAVIGMAYVKSRQG